MIASSKVGIPLPSSEGESDHEFFTSQALAVVAHIDDEIVFETVQPDVDVLGPRGDAVVDDVGNRVLD